MSKFSEMFFNLRTRLWLSAYQNEEERRVARVQRAMLAVYWLSCAVVALADIFWGDANLLPILLLAAALQLPSLFLLLRGRLTLSVSHSIGFYIFAMTALATQGQGIHDYVIMAFPAVIMFAGLVLSWRGLFLSAALSAGAVFWLVAGELNGWFVPRRNFQPDWADLIASEVLLAIVFAAAYRLILNLEQEKEQARRELAERRRAEEALSKSERRIRSLFENAAVGIYRTTPDGRILFANPAAVRALGYASFEELARRNLENDDFFPNTPRALFSERLKREGFISGAESVWKRKDGALIHVRESAVLTRDEDGSLYYDGVFEDISEQKRAEESLDETLREFNRFFTVSLDLFCIADMDGYFLRLNPEWEKALGYSLEELEGKRFLDFVHPADLSSTLEAVSRLAAGEIILNFENRYRHKDGSYRWIEWRSTPVGDRIYAAARDVTERRRMEEKLKRDEGLIRSVNNNLISGMVYQVVRFRDGSRKFTYLSQAVMRMYGVLPREGMEDPSLIYGRVHPDDRQRVFEEEERANRNLSVFQTEARVINPDGSVRWSSFISKPSLLEDGTTCWDGIELDITARKQSEEMLRQANEQLQARLTQIEELQAELREQAIRDPLTGLYNRHYLRDVLEREFSRAMRENHPISVIMLDMDDLKVFNDSYGHAAGDEALRALAACLKTMTRMEDVVCRYGGDEIIIVAAKANAQDAFRRVEQWREFLAARPLQLEAETVPVRFTAGIASYPAHGLSADEIMHHADVALYRAKARGRNCSQIFS